MGRKRNDESSNWLPPRVYRGKSAYEFHPKCGGNIRLCNLDASRSLVLKRYQEELENIHNSPPPLLACAKNS